jgi:hypothetical protein
MFFATRGVLAWRVDQKRVTMYHKRFVQHQAHLQKLANQHSSRADVAICQDWIQGIAPK